MATIHISETEAANDFAGLMARVRAGEEIIIESQSQPVAVLKPATAGPGRLLSEIIASTKARAEERGCEPVMDEDFAADVREIVRNRKPADHSAWD